MGGILDGMAGKVQVTVDSARGTEVTSLGHDPVNHPNHYCSHPSGVECITVVEHMSFNVGNAIKYLWRMGQKQNALEDLRKARWYIDREIKRLGGE